MKNEQGKRMPFGKHKGKLIEDLPNDILKWYAENLSQDWLATLCDEEYQWRVNNGVIAEED